MNTLLIVQGKGRILITRKNIGQNAIQSLSNNVARNLLFLFLVKSPVVNMSFHLLAMITKIKIELARYPLLILVINQASLKTLKS